MRWLLLLGLVGCTGGQTGEITRLSECDHTQTVHSLSSLPEVESDVDQSAQPWSGTLTWFDGEETELALDVVRIDDSVEERGFDACLHWRTEIEVDATTVDGRLDTTLRGSLDVRESGAEMRARMTRDDGVEVWLELIRDDSGVRGTLWEKSDPELDDELVATW